MRGTFPQQIKDELNGSGCQYDESHMDTLINATNNVASEVKSLNDAISTLNGHHKDIIRYLMIVVCVIALGKSALELIPTAITKAASLVKDDK